MLFQLVVLSVKELSLMHACAGSSLSIVFIARAMHMLNLIWINQYHRRNRVLIADQLSCVVLSSCMHVHMWRACVRGSLG